jgi:hypothetical protein
MYSDSGKYTLIIPEHVDGCPPARGKADLDKVKMLEGRLSLATDGTRFRYTNSFRCPHCGAAYIDFEKFPEDRECEYYGNHFYGEKPMHYE